MNNYFLEILEIINNSKSKDELKEKLSGYHASDIADALETLDKDERIKVYQALDLEDTAEIFTYFEDVENYINEIPVEKAADIIEQLDSDEAIDVLNELEDEDKQEIIEHLEDEDKERVIKQDSYDDDTIAAYMTDNYITIHKSSSIKDAMSHVVRDAGDHDNVYIIYVLDDDNKFYGAIDLKDLIVARKDDNLDKICMTNYPRFYVDEDISDCINRLKDYKEQSIPIISHDDVLLGVITSDNILDAATDEFDEDYAKLAGLSDKEDIDESIFKSVCKRIPWLIILLFLGLVISSLIGTFEALIATMPVIVFFQSIILDMSGNVGTQSLAVTIRTLTEENDSKKRNKVIWKELKIGFVNGLLIAFVAFIFCFLYLFIKKQEVIQGTGFVIYDILKVAGIIASSLVLAMTLSSLVGSIFPILLTKCHIDPAVASGPFITTINDIVAVLVYYGLSYILFFMVM